MKCKKLLIEIKKNKSFTIIVTLFFSIIFNYLLFINVANSQCKPMIKIDGKATVVNTNDDFGLTLPFWLKETQTLAIGSSVSSISVIEFSVSTTNTLEFSQVLNITSTSGVSVPSKKVWKIESIAKVNNSSIYNRVTFSTATTYIWKVPACAEEICIDMWGGGGGGGGHTGNPSAPWYGGGGGGGGGYGSQCFAVTPGETYTIVVGAGGAGGIGTLPASNGSIGGTSSVTGTGISMTVTGGNGGLNGSSYVGIGGDGGTSTATTNAQGSTGTNGCSISSAVCSLGGTGAGNGGVGGLGKLNGTGLPGSEPGGGGGGGNYISANSTASGGVGASGRVIISW